MVKAYLRYQQSASFGVVFSPNSEALFDHHGRLAICGALEAINVWNVKQGSLVSVLIPTRNSPNDKPISVTTLALHPKDPVVAAGYNDGSIRIWNISTSECLLTFRGHKSTISTLRFSGDGARLASGSNDTDIIIWDVVGQCGLFCLRGHVDVVTTVLFIGDRLISASKDTFIKVWELESQHCVQTLTGHHHEVWSVDVDPSGTLLVSGSTDPDLRLWRVGDSIEFIGTVQRQHAKSRVSSVRFHDDIVGIQSSGKVLELFKIRDESAMKKKMKSRVKRFKEKHGEDADISEVSKPIGSDYLELFHTISTKDNQRSLAFASQSILIGLSTNMVQVYSLKSTMKESVDIPLAFTIDDSGHRSGVRAAALSRDDTMLVTVSNGSVKVWNTFSQKCIRTLPSGYGLCCAFVPGDQHILVGTKSGDLELYSLNSAELLHRVQAHSGALWSIDLHPNGCGFVTGGADKEVKFWSFELIQDDDPASKKRKKSLGVVHTRTLRLTDDVLCVKYTPDGSKIAASLLDSTIKVFHEDSLKFFLSLYGHKLPVLCMDISSDGALLCSSGADKNLKIWGLDFGDCHKSLFAHDDSVMACKFLPETHYIFTASKDRQIRFWDGDKFEHVYSLNGHHSEIWNLEISKNGAMFVSVGNDCSIRLWKQTEEQVFLEAERENRLEEMFEEGAVEKPSVGIGALPESGIVDPKVFESSAVLESASVTTVKSGERLMEAIDFIESDRLALSEATASGKAHKPNPMMLGMPHLSYLLHVMRIGRPSELDVILMVLPYSYAKRLIRLLHEFVTSFESDGIELAVRSVLFLLQIHHQQLVASGDLDDCLADLRDAVRSRVRGLKDLVGFNIAALQYLKDELQNQSNAVFYNEREQVVS